MGVKSHFRHKKEWNGTEDPVNNIKWLNNLVNNLADTLRTYYTEEKAYKQYNITICFMGWKLPATAGSAHLLMSISANGYRPYIKSGIYIYDCHGNNIGSYSNSKALYKDLKHIYTDIQEERTDKEFIAKNYIILGILQTKTLYLLDNIQK